MSSPTDPILLRKPQRIACVLDVDTGDLLGRPRPVPSGGADQARVLAIRDALTSVDDLLGEVDAPDAPDLAELDRSISYAWGAYWAGRYGMLAALRSTLTYVLISQGRFTDAERVAVVTAQSVQPSGNATTPELSVYGGLLLRGATAAARDGRAGAAATLLGEAGEVAGRTGAARTDYEVVFGPSNWVMQSADVAVVTEDYPSAVAVARRMPLGSALPLAARSPHLTDVAHAQAVIMSPPRRCLDVLVEQPGLRQPRR